MKVEIIYFKDTGKYYSEGSYETEKEALGDIWSELRTMFINGKRPGLIDGRSGFHAFNGRFGLVC